MPRFPVDDGFHSHPKAWAASLAALGLWTVAGSWSNDQGTDGLIPDHMIQLLSRGQTELVRELCDAGLWRRTRGGYQFHQWDADGDGTPRNITRDEAIARRSKKSTGGSLGNHRRWHVKEGRVDPACAYCQDDYRPPDRSTDRSSDGTTEPPSDSGPNPPIPSPLPIPTDMTSGQSVRAGARTREAARHLIDRYGLTEDESALVIAEVEARARQPIKHLVKYMRSMAEGDLADIASAVMDATKAVAKAPPEPPLRAVPDLPPRPDSAPGAEPNADFLAVKQRLSRKATP